MGKRLGERSVTVWTKPDLLYVKSPPARALAEPAYALRDARYLSARSSAGCIFMAWSSRRSHSPRVLQYYQRVHSCQAQRLLLPRLSSLRKSC